MDWVRARLQAETFAKISYIGLPCQGYCLSVVRAAAALIIASRVDFNSAKFGGMEAAAAGVPAAAQACEVDQHQMGYP